MPACSPGHLLHLPVIRAPWTLLAKPLHWLLRLRCRWLRVPWGVPLPLLLLACWLVLAPVLLLLLVVCLLLPVPLLLLLSVLGACWHPLWALLTPDWMSLVLVVLLRPLLMLVKCCLVKEALRILSLKRCASQAHLVRQLFPHLPWRSLRVSLRAHPLEAANDPWGLQQQRAIADRERRQIPLPLHHVPPGSSSTLACSTGHLTHPPLHRAATVSHLGAMWAIFVSQCCPYNSWLGIVAHVFSANVVSTIPR